MELRVDVESAVAFGRHGASRWPGERASGDETLVDGVDGGDLVRPVLCMYERRGEILIYG